MHLPAIDLPVTSAELTILESFSETFRNRNRVLYTHRWDNNSSIRAKNAHPCAGFGEEEARCRRLPTASIIIRLPHSTEPSSVASLGQTETPDPKGSVLLQSENRLRPNTSPVSREKSCLFLENYGTRNEMSNYLFGTSQGDVVRFEEADGWDENG